MRHCGAGARTSPASSASATGSNAIRTLNAVSALAADDVWVVGAGPQKSVILHWDGSVWTTSFTGHVGWELFGVDARVADDVWTVGGNVERCLIHHWDGTPWMTQTRCSEG